MCCRLFNNQSRDRYVYKNEEKYMAKLDEMAPLAKADGCTKTNPVIPEIDEFKELFIKVYRGE